MTAPTRRAVPRRIAHRGASRDHRENSLAAFDAALRERCQAIELDVQLSADGVPFIHHDRTLSGVGGGRRRVRHRSAEQLRELQLPELSVVLERYARRTELLVEIKAYGDDPAHHAALTEATVAAIAAADAIDRCWILCFDARVLDHVAELEPTLARVLNIEPPRRISAGIARQLDTLSALSMKIGRITPAFAGAVHDRGCPTMTYTCNTERRLRRALDRGIAGIMSDRPAWLAARLDETERR